jgi:hypothetical protein
MLGTAAIASIRPRRTRGSRIAWAAALASLAIVALQISGIMPAHATPTKPHSAWSYYVLSTSTTTAYNLGCNQGTSDSDNGYSGSLVFLDFGGQTDGRTGTELINGTVISNATVESLAEQFADGYYICTGSDTTSILTLAIGTNNSYYGVDTAGGETWADDVNAVSTWVSDNIGQVVVWGGDDIEPSWSSESAAIDWSNGFADVSDSLYLNYGSADGCPESSYDNGACNNGWDQYDVWYVSYGSPPAVTAPQIYYSANALQWTMICLYGANDQSGPVYYEGPLDENDLDSSTATSTQAWDWLENDLNSYSDCAQTMPYSLEVHDE